MGPFTKRGIAEFENWGISQRDLSYKEARDLSLAIIFWDLLFN